MIDTMEPITSTISVQLEHRTIRKFTAESLSSEQFNQLMEVARSTATSRGLQHASIIRVTDQDLRNEMAAIATQAYMTDSPELLLFIVDTHRSQRILDENGSDGPGARSMDSFTEGFTDACLMAQNVAVAAESMGLGTNFFGNVLNDVPRIVELLKLPKLTFPVLGLTMGFPDQEPQLKPRMDMSLRVMENGYTEPESWSKALSEYDDVMQTYYDLRDANRRVDSFTKQTVGRLAAVNPMRARMVEFIASQGFDVDPV